MSEVKFGVRFGVIHSVKYDGESFIYYDHSISELGYMNGHTKKSFGTDSHHLYITSTKTEKYADGDWFHDKIINGDTGNLVDIVYQKKIGNEYKCSSTERKILASTNPNLGVPLIPMYFVMKYIKTYGTFAHISSVTIDIRRGEDGDFIIDINKDNEVSVNRNGALWSDIRSLKYKLKDMKNESFECWNEDSKQGYLTAVETIENFINNFL